MHMQFQDGSRNINSCVHNAVVWLIHSAAIKKLEYQDVRTTQIHTKHKQFIFTMPLNAYGHTIKWKCPCTCTCVNVSTRLTSES